MIMTTALLNQNLFTISLLTNLVFVYVSPPSDVSASPPSECPPGFETENSTNMVEIKKVYEKFDPDAFQYAKDMIRGGSIKLPTSLSANLPSICIRFPPQHSTQCKQGECISNSSSFHLCYNRIAPTKDSAVDEMIEFDAQSRRVLIVIDSKQQMASGKFGVKSFTGLDLSTCALLGQTQHEHGNESETLAQNASPWLGFPTLTVRDCSSRTAPATWLRIQVGCGTDVQANQPPSPPPETSNLLFRRIGARR